MKLAILILLNLIAFQSFAQLTKYFTKNVNRSIITDSYLQPASEAIIITVKAEFYFDKNTSKGIVKIFDLAHGNQWKVLVNQMYTKNTNGIKIYYFQSSDEKFKISTSKEEKGFAILSYEEKLITVYYNE